MPSARRYRIRNTRKAPDVGSNPSVVTHCPNQGVISFIVVPGNVLALCEIYLFLMKLQAYEPGLLKNILSFFSLHSYIYYIIPRQISVNFPPNASQFQKEIYIELFDSKFEGTKKDLEYLLCISSPQIVKFISVEYLNISNVRGNYFNIIYKKMHHVNFTNLTPYIQCNTNNFTSYLLKSLLHAFVYLNNINYKVRTFYIDMIMVSQHGEFKISLKPFKDEPEFNINRALMTTPSVCISVNREPLSKKYSWCLGMILLHLLDSPFTNINHSLFAFLSHVVDSDSSVFTEGIQCSEEILLLLNDLLKRDFEKRIELDDLLSHSFITQPVDYDSVMTILNQHILPLA